MSGRIPALILCLIVGIAPLALGSNRPLPWAFNAILTGFCCFLTATVLLMPGRRSMPLRLDLVAPSLLLWGAAMAWAIVQVVPLDSASLVHPTWMLLGDTIGETVRGRISVNLHGTLLSATRLVTYCATLLCAFILARDAGNADRMLRGFLLFASAFAIYGLTRYAWALPSILWFDAAPQDTLSSTFVNRNTAATYFGMAACASLSLLLRRGRHLSTELSGTRSAAATAERLVSGLLSVFGFELAGFLLLLTATLLTQSRAGIISTIAALTAGLALTARRWRHRMAGPAGIIILALVAAGTFTAIAVSGKGVAARFVTTGISAETRIGVFRSSLAALRDHPLAGTGLGTFQDVYPLYRTEPDGAGLVWDKAHNDYAEILLGLGIPAGSAVILGIAILAMLSLRGVFRRQRNSHIPLSAAMASLLVGLHAIFDFSLQIQAVAMSFALLLGLGVAQSVSTRT